MLTSTFCFPARRSSIILPNCTIRESYRWIYRKLGTAVLLSAFTICSKSIYKRLTGPGMDKIQLPFNKCSQMMSNCPPEETFLHPSRIELSREALKNNLRLLRAHAQKGVRI